MANPQPQSPNSSPNPNDKFISGCRTCQGKVEFCNTKPGYYEGVCPKCGSVWQCPIEPQRRSTTPMTTIQDGNRVTITMSQSEYSKYLAITDELEAAHRVYFAQGKFPGMMEAKRIWDRLMGLWGSFRG